MGKSTVFVDGLPWFLTGGHLRRLSGRFGSVDDAFVVRKKRTHCSGPYGFVIFGSEKDAVEAVKSLDGERVAGCHLKVCVAKFARKREDPNPRFGDSGSGRCEVIVGKDLGSCWRGRLNMGCEYSWAVKVILRVLNRYRGKFRVLKVDDDQVLVRCYDAATYWALEDCIRKNMLTRVAGEWRRGRGGVSSRNCWVVVSGGEALGREEIDGMLLRWGSVRKVEVVNGVNNVWFRCLLNTDWPCHISEELILVRADVGCWVKVEEETCRRRRRRAPERIIEEVPKSSSMDEKAAAESSFLAEAGVEPEDLLFSSVSNLSCRKSPPLPPMEGTNKDEPTVIRDRGGSMLRSKSVKVEENKKDMPLIRWRKGELIGCGAFGRVHMGMNLDSGELLAVKEVAITSSKKTQVYIRELEKEVNLLKNLSHPNIVRYLGTAREDDSLNILLEFVPGGSISSLLGKFDSFPESVIKMYTKQILLGLEYLHENKIMHRDIKGANILVDDKGCIKLADFGASKKVEALATITGAKSMKGTAYWMAPEVIVQSGHSYSADIWSVGCTVIEMATGKAPWSQQYQEVNAAMLYIGTTKSHPPIPDHLSVEAEDFLLKCLQKEPDLRPTASELLKHPFVNEVSRKFHTVLRSSLIDSSKQRMPSHGVEIKKSMNLETRSSCKDFGELGGFANCSTFHPDHLSEQGSLWKPVDFDDDDMCRIDDDLVLGASKKFKRTSLSRDCNQSFNPMCEPTDDRTYKSDLSPDSEMTKSRPIYGPGNRSFGYAEVGSGFTFPTEDDEKAMKLKKLHSPLYEFYNSLNVSRRMSCIGTGNKENVSNNCNLLPRKSKSPNKVGSRRLSTAVDVSNIGDVNIQYYGDVTEQDPLSPRFAEREGKCKEAKPLHNYSTQIGEEFSLGFMRDRFNPKKLIPADSSQAGTPGHLDLKGISGINYTECESGSDISVIATADADKESRESIQNNSSIHGGVKGSFQSMQQAPHATSDYNSHRTLMYTSSGTYDSSSTKLKILCSFPYYTRSEIALPQPSVLPVSELKDPSLNDSDILSKDTQEKDAELKGNGLIQPELENRQDFANGPFVVPSQARGVNTKISLLVEDSSAVTVPKLEMQLFSKDLNSEGMRDETLLISNPPDVIDPSSGNEYFPSGNSLAPSSESNPSDSTYFDSSLPPQRVFHSLWIPREQGKLLNRISKSDDSHNSQFLANQSHTDNSDSSQFLITPLHTDNSHNSQFLVNSSHTDDSQQDLIAAPVEKLQKVNGNNIPDEQSISTERCCSLMNLKLLITSLLKIWS